MKNRSILDVVRCLVADSAVPGHLWAEAIRAVCTLLNLCPSKSQRDKSLDKIFSGKKPCIFHLRTFGSLVFNFLSTNQKLGVN